MAIIWKYSRPRDADPEEDGRQHQDVDEQYEGGELEPGEQRCEAVERLARRILRIVALLDQGCDVFEI
jgi:hypothetical protein